MKADQIVCISWSGTTCPPSAMACHWRRDDARWVLVFVQMSASWLSSGSQWRAIFYCAVIVKCVDAQTRAKTGFNELLRD